MSGDTVQPATSARRPLLRPGGLLWLVAQQARLGWRSLLARRGALWVLGGGLLLMVVIGLALSGPLRRVAVALGGLDQLSDLPLLVLGLASLLAFTLMLSVAVSGTLEALYERGDLDLLLGAPIPPRRVLASRVLGVALLAAQGSALLVVPLLVIGLAAGLWRSLGLLPWLAALALLAAALGALLTLGLVRLLGVRAARTVASVVGALAGASFYLASQWGNITGLTGNRMASAQTSLALFERLQAALNGPGPLGASSPLWWPARAAWLEPGPTLALLTLAGLVFAATVPLLERAFLHGAQDAASHPARRAARASGRTRFRSGAAAVLFKEWRLLLRDPLLLSRTLLQLVYLVPLSLVLLRGGGSAALGGTASILLGGTLAGALARLTVDAEDAPDLLQSAPLGLDRLSRLKLLAAVAPVLTIVVVLAALVAWRVAAWPALLGLALGAVSVIGSGLIVLWRPLPLRRADLMRRGRSGDLLGGLGTFAMQAALLGAMYGLVRGAGWGLAPLVVGLLIPAAFGVWGRRSEGL